MNEDDDRTPEKLIDGENDQVDGTHCWIAPILPNVVCRRNSKINFEKFFLLRRLIEYL